MKYKSVRFGEMGSDAFSLAAPLMLLKISVITGWQVPGETDTYGKLLLEQFKKKIVDSYQELNTDEFEFAMREYATQIKDWGKAMNLSLIDSAVYEYMKKRRLLSDLEERLRSQVQVPQIAPESDWSEACNHLLQQAKDAKIDKSIIPAPICDWLIQQGHLTITPKEARIAIEDARFEKLHALSLEHEMHTLDTHQEDVYLELKSDTPTLLLSPDLVIELKNNARRECAREYFKKVAAENK